MMNRFVKLQKKELKREQKIKRTIAEYSSLQIVVARTKNHEEKIEKRRQRNR